MGHCSVLHNCSSLAGPTQSLPPNLGIGSLQRRSLFWDPPPQVTEHVSQGDHGPQPPLTEKDRQKRELLN